MPQILKEGDLSRLDPEYRIVCCECGCEALFKRSEGRPSPDQRDSGTYTFKCPTCERSIYFQTPKSGLY